MAHQHTHEPHDEQGRGGGQLGVVVLQQTVDVEEEDQHHEQAEGSQGVALSQDAAQTAQQGGKGKGPHPCLLAAPLALQAHKQSQCQGQPQAPDGQQVGPLHHGQVRVDANNHG